MAEANLTPPEPLKHKTQNMIHYDSLHVGSDDVSHLFAQIVFLFPLYSSPPFTVVGFGISGELKLISFGEFSTTLRWRHLELSKNKDKKF